MNIDRKKVAVVITGHLRTFNLHFNDFKKNLLDLHDVDLYLSTWDHNHIGPMLGANYVRFSEEAIKDNLSIYPNVKKICISSYKQVNQTSESFFSNYGSFGVCEDPDYKKYRGGIVNRKTMPYNAGQWYPVQEGFRSIDNPEQYDVLFRTRFDIHLYKPVIFLPNEIVAVHPGNKRLPDTNQLVTELYNIKNHIFYGSPYIAEIMKDIYTTNLEVSCKFTNLATDSLLEYILRNNTKNYPLTIDENFREGKEYGVWK